MRAIKFRGKRLDNGEWVYGCYSYLKPPLSETVEHLIIKDGFTPVPIDSDTLGEYTGLKDSNGVEVYEGDIVRFMYNSTPQKEYVGEVKWSERDLAWEFAGLLIESTPRKTMGVIGNRFANPELLEGKS